MRKIINIIRKKALLFILLLLSLTGHTQILFLSNQSSTSTTFDVDLMITIPSLGRRLTAVSAGINYTNTILNGGAPSVTASNSGGTSWVLVPGSVAPEILANGGLNTMNTTCLGPTYGHLRIVQVSKSTSLVDLPEGTYRVGTFRFTNTTTWSQNSNAELWLQPTNAGGLTNCIVSNAPYGASTPITNTTTITNPALTLTHTSVNKYSVPLNITPTCPTAATASNLLAESCTGAANGSATITLTGASNNSSSVTYSVDGGSSQNATLSAGAFTVLNLSAGSHSVAVTYPSCTAVATSSFDISAGAALTTNTTTITACDSYVWNGTTYTTSGVYTGTTTNCVTESLNLTITPSSTNTLTITACDSYVWNGTTYTASGVYTGTTTNCVTELSLIHI